VLLVRNRHLISPGISGLFSVLLISSCLCLSSCRNSTVKSKPAGNPASYVIQHAEKFTLVKNDSCTILTILNPWQGAENIKQVFYLVRRDFHRLKNIDSLKTILVPVKSLICTSTTHIAMVSALGEEDAITGISGANYICNKNILEKIAKGTIPDIGYDNGINSEMILRIKPDIMMMYGVGGEGESISAKIREMGLTVMYDADYLENDPLGKAEWIKLFGALFCKEQIADSIFDTLASSYNHIRDYVAASLITRPKVLLGLPFRDTWFISPGNSYVSRLIEDAGGDYLWKEKESNVSMPLSLENVFMKSVCSDFWLNIGSVSSRKEITSFDPRLMEIHAFKLGNLYNNNARMSERGGNDYWESGTMSPDIILKDIASILHPELFKGHLLYYYTRVE
jgi:iron complex transport system substrate-binding protein